ncbi:MAG: glycoside hydrolase family 3 N-terminal domain-containing protein [Verrucomicrobiia bacterium]
MRAFCNLALATLLLSGRVFASPAATDTDTERKVAALLAKMTLEEKAGQLTQYASPKEQLAREGKVGSFLNVVGADKVNALQKVAVEQSRLGVPLIFAYDVIHGYRTIFPIPLAEACSWDPDLAEQTAAVAAKEAAAAGIRWTFAPMVDIARDSRWGRIAEGSGEDPFLGAAFARARVRGFQGVSLNEPTSVVACAKHYAAYGAAESGRDYNTVDISVKTLREVYLPPFKAAVDAGVGTLMSAFNDLNGTPASANRFTLTEVLRNECGFRGFVVSDWRAIAELMVHGIAATPAQAAERALHAGVDMDMEGSIYLQNLPQLVREGKVPQSALDEAVRRILRIKFALGLFEHPYADPDREKSVLLANEHRQLAREAARKSIVLLKNDQNLLPLSKAGNSVAVIGPLADSRSDLLGCWHGQGHAEDVVSVLEGLKGKIGPEKIRFAKGCNIQGNDDSGFADAVKLAQESDVAIVVLGESAGMSGEAASRVFLGLPGVQEDLLKAVHATGKPIILVLMNGRPLAIPWAAQHVPAILETWQLGVEAGNAIADALFGDCNPGGKLTTSFPRSVGQVPIYYGHKNTGRPPSDTDKSTSRYLDSSHTPLFPFGFGLSYSQFEYRNLKLSADKMRRDGSIKVSADVTNVSLREGDEIVQLYICGLVASTTRPVKELKGFQRISLRPGQTRTVEFTLAAQDLGCYDENLKYVVEPGPFKVWVAPNSVSGLEAGFELVDK